MKNLIPTACLLGLFIAAPSAPADDLFSEVTITSVFAEKSASGAGQSASPNGLGRRVTGAASLQKLLESTGMTTQEISSNSVAVALEAPQTKDKILNAVIVVRIDEGILNIGVPLVRIDESKASSSKLLQMMNQGRNSDAIYFVYDPDSKWVGVRRRLSNRGITTERLVGDLNEMVTFAQNTIAIWQGMGDTLKTVEQNEGSVDAKPQATPKQPAPRATAPKASATSLDGTWSAAGANGQGFAISFTGNQFRLAIVHNGKSNQSSGTWSLAGDQMRLAGDGMTVTGKLSITSATAFELTLPNQQPLKFKKS